MPPSLLEQFPQRMFRLWLAFFQARQAEMFTEEAYSFDLFLDNQSERWLLQGSCIASQKFSRMTLTSVDVSELV